MIKGIENIRFGDILAFTLGSVFLLAGLLPASAQQSPSQGPAAKAPSESGLVAPAESLKLPAAPGSAAAAAAKAVAAAEGPTIKVPKDVLEGAVAGTPEGLEKVRKFLVGDRLESQTVTDRSIALVRAARDTPTGQDPQQFLAISERISGVAKNIFEGSAITKLTVDKTFHPGPNDKAWKFGPNDAETPPGFEKITPQDPRLKGIRMRGVHRPGSDPLTSSGIVGVRNFQSELPNGEWRVTMITDDLGEPQTSLAPFGQKMSVNSTHINLLESDPSQWLERAVLSNRTITPPTPKNVGALPPGLNISDGVVTHQAKPPANPSPDVPADAGLPKQDVASTTAGALQLKTRVNENRLGVNWTPPQNRPDQETYVVAIIAEPANKRPAMQSQVTSLDIESKIFAQAIKLTAPPKADKPVNNEEKKIDVLPPPTVQPASES